LIVIIKNNKIENEKKFMNEKLYGEKPSIVVAPRKKGAKNITKNLLFRKAVKPIFHYLVIEFKNFFSTFCILK